MNILITGVTGFIGYHLASRLLSKGHVVTGTMRRAGMASANSKRRLNKLESLERVYRDNFKVVRNEDFESLYTAFQKLKPEVCVHLAGRSWVRESIGYPDLYEDGNYRFTASLLEALRLSFCRRIVFASTVMVYGKNAPLPYMEHETGTAPLSPYGASKLAGEVLLNSYRLMHRMETVSLRLCSVYGPDLRMDCVPYLMASAIMKQKPFTIFGEGDSMRDYIEIEDVVSAFESAALGTESHLSLNIGSGFGTTLLELLNLVELHMGKKAERVFKPAVVGELPIAIPDITLSIEKLNWEPKVSIEQGMARMAAWFKSADCPPIR